MLFEQIEQHEQSVFSVEPSEINWENTTIKQAKTIAREQERKIEKARLASLEQAILEPIAITRDELNTGLRNFFNPYTISAIMHQPQQKDLYLQLSKNAQNTLADYLKEIAIEYPHATHTPDWTVFIRTFNFLRALGPRLLKSQWPSKVLFAEPIKQSISP